MITLHKFSSTTNLHLFPCEKFVNRFPGGSSGGALTRRLASPCTALNCWCTASCAHAVPQVQVVLESCPTGPSESQHVTTKCDSYILIENSISRQLQEFYLSQNYYDY